MFSNIFLKQKKFKKRTPNISKKPSRYGTFMMSLVYLNFSNLTTSRTKYKIRFGSWQQYSFVRTYFNF